MDSKETDYYFIQLELGAISKVLKINSRAHRVVWRNKDPRLVL